MCYSHECHSCGMILIGGGSRSGKSSEALRRLHQAGPHIGFIATATPSDEEMQERINRHRADRCSGIITWEEPIQVAERILAVDGHYDAIVIDCLTLWLSNLMFSEADIKAETDKLLQVAAKAVTQTIFVTNEVGCSIVPDNALARRFRDEAGQMNQRFAAQASEVYWMAFGLGLRLK